MPLTEDELRVMEVDAERMKAELNVRAHLRALVAEVRHLSGAKPTKPTHEEAKLALDFMAYATAVDLESLTGVETKAVAVLERYFSS